MTTIERSSVIAGVVGLVLLAIGVVVDPRQALTSYLFAYATILTIALGALIQVMMSHVTGARWFTALRRLGLDVAGAIPALAVLAIPLFVGVSVIYPWTTPSALAAEARAIVERKSAWLNVPFFVVRGVIYLAVWLVVSSLLRRWSLREDVQTRRLRRLSAVGLVAVGLTMTFAAFDWLMSLEPAWYSTVYGVYVFAGGFVAALALIGVLAHGASKRGAPLADVVTAEHFAALGKLQLTFVMFWAYIAFSQYLIIWLGDIPLDTSWYVSRATGSWGALALVVVAGQFAIPFVVLLSRTLKRRADVIAALGWLLIAAHVLDVYWLVLPALHPGGVSPSWLDAAALSMVGGFATAGASWRARGRAPFPLGDPHLTAAMDYGKP